MTPAVATLSIGNTSVEQALTEYQENSLCWKILAFSHLSDFDGSREWFYDRTDDDYEAIDHAISVLKTIGFLVESAGRLFLGDTKVEKLRRGPNYLRIDHGQLQSLRQCDDIKLLKLYIPGSAETFRKFKEGLEELTEKCVEHGLSQENKDILVVVHSHVGLLQHFSERVQI